MSEATEPAILTERADGVVTLRINRPERRNALTDDVRAALIAALEKCDGDATVGCVVIAGNDDVFAAGADIAAMRERTMADELNRAGGTGLFERVAACRTPLIAAVSGFALGGGCELALACDMIVASETAEFGQPEITLGIIPGGGGTQRLARVAGKQRAMELVLTGKRITAAEAYELGFVNAVTRKKEWLSKAQELAAVVARRPRLAARLAKQAVLAADETALSAGLAYERRLFEATFATDDRAEGMAAFVEKRRPKFGGS